ncbi:MAG: hypothetical protein IKU66_02795 [Clostridia bacterium]|nr:hypothetical protein [Clostridia bacterium]
MVSIIYIKLIKNHTDSVRQLVLMIENIKILIIYKNLSVEDIFDYVSKSDIYGLLGFIKVLNQNIKENGRFYEMVNDALFLDTENYLDKEDIDNVKSFLSMLGNSDAEGQKLNCDLYKNMFNKKLSALEQNEEKERKTGISLILGIGFVLILLII